MTEFKKQFSTGYKDPIEGTPDLTVQESSLIVAILSLGTTVGALASAPMADSIGRRLSLLVAAAIFCVGGALQTAAWAIPMLIAGR
jgi:predicted MFS family arabinose efflux permease